MPPSPPTLYQLSKSIHKSISSILNSSILFSEWISSSNNFNDFNKLKNGEGEEQQQQLKDDPTPIAISVEYMKEVFGLPNSDDQLFHHNSDDGISLSNSAASSSTSSSSNQIDDDLLLKQVKYHIDVENGRKILVGYPTLNVQNVFQEIAFIWMLWMREGTFPIQFQQFPNIDDDFEYYEKFSSRFTDKIMKLQHSVMEFNNLTMMDEYIQQVIVEMKLRGIQTCLRMRKTTGSISYMIPTYRELIDSFNEVLEKTSGLTVGARALAKHCHRSETDQFWGGSTVLKGNAKEKNRKSLAILEKIVNEATFINAHILPHNIPCVEVRNFEGYGSRWVYKRGNTPSSIKTTTESSATANSTTDSTTIDNSNQVIFRGFLEPYREQGHTTGWKH